MASSTAVTHTITARHFFGLQASSSSPAKATTVPCQKKEVAEVAVAASLLSVCCKPWAVGMGLFDSWPHASAHASAHALVAAKQKAAEAESSSDAADCCNKAEVFGFSGMSARLILGWCFPACKSRSPHRVLAVEVMGPLALCSASVFYNQLAWILGYWLPVLL